jgi:hypothetical protein
MFHMDMNILILLPYRGVVKGVPVVLGKLLTIAKPFKKNKIANFIAVLHLTAGFRTPQ